MNLLKISAQLYMILFFAFSIISGRVKISKRFMRVAYALEVLALSVIAYYSNATTSDLTRHFGWMRQIRRSSFSLSQFLFGGGGVGNKNYTTLISFNVLRYAIAKLTTDDYWLPAVCTFATYSIVCYIMYDWNCTTERRRKISLLVHLFSFTCMPYIHVVSGLRNALAASIAALSIYLYLYKQKKLILYAVLTLIAATIHPAILVTVPFVFLSRLNFGTTGFAVVIIISAASQYIAKIFSESSFVYFQLIGRAYYIYTSENQYRSSRFILYGVTLLVIILLAAYFLKRKKIIQGSALKKQRPLYDFLVLYMFYIIGNIGNYDMVLRPAYVLGAMAPIAVSLLTDARLRDRESVNAVYMKMGNLALTCSAYVLCLYVNYRFLDQYLSWFMGR